MAKFMLGAVERVKKDDSIPVELLPSNKILYAARLNSDEDADVTPTKCTNLKEVFEKFQPSFNVDLETEQGEPINADFQIRAMKDFSSKELIEQNDYLQETYYAKEMMNDLEKQLKKNKALQKILEDKEKKAALLKVAQYYVDLLSE
ncbi:MAG: type VI secretion system contractile sheath small subunit [candidate division Zixibacteria bacterium]|jgi:predicted component of type VI protein secretion system|nr:type VI secretion system contractile sheath small subunit [candidate division Zixibacteria bacterium]